MSSEPSPESVLDGIPEWRGAAYRELSGGLTNRTWLVEQDGQRAVLKIDQGTREVPFNSRRDEARIQKAAVAAGLANNVLFVSDTVLMTEYVDGIVWSLDCLEDNANLDKLAAALRKLHSLPLTGRTFDALGAAREYIRRLGNANGQEIAACLRKIKAGPLPHNLCCCHNDLVVANILNTPETRFLDWEYACDNDPFFDLATIVAHHKLTTEQTDHLLNAYFDGDGKRWREQLNRQKGVYDALLWLWRAARAQREAQRGQGGDR
jgi:thiamine kinase-like enzyme